ncbi:MAG: AraC family transcriptional regulator [Gemmatimonadaceae bacterium]
MRTPQPTPIPKVATQSVRRVAFDRRKYGRHLLIDVAWIHDLHGFLVGQPHALDFFDVTLVTRGTGSFWLDSHRHDVHAGAVFFSTPGQVRRWDTRQLDGICLFFEASFIREFLQDELFLQRLPFFHNDAARAALTLPPADVRRTKNRLAAMQRELAHYRRDSADLLRAQLHETLVVLARQFAAEHGVQSQRATHAVVSKFVEMVESDAASCHRIADYAKALAVTPGHLSVLCTQYIGHRAKQVLHNVLVSRARRRLLYSDDTSAQIATSLGFQDPSYFTRFFRRETGQTPQEFRKSLRDGASASISQ